MKKIALGACLIFGCGFTSAEAIYRCGNEYTNSAAPGCKLVSGSIVEQVASNFPTYVPIEDNDSLAFFFIPNRVIKVNAGKYVSTWGLTSFKKPKSLAQSENPGFADALSNQLYSSAMTNYYFECKSRLIAVKRIAYYFGQFADVKKISDISRPSEELQFKETIPSSISDKMLSMACAK